MVTCAVVNCPNRTNSDRADDKKGVRFFNIPKVIVNQCALTQSRTERRRATWIARINRKDLKDSDIKPYTRVCSSHFIKGVPAALWDESNPDWAPSQNLGYSLSSPGTCPSSARYDRAVERGKRRDHTSPCVDVTNKKRRFQPPNQAPEDSVEQENSLLVDRSINLDVTGAAVLPADPNPNQNDIITTTGAVDLQPSVSKEEDETVSKQLSELRDLCEKRRKLVRSLGDKVTNLEVDKQELQASLQLADAKAKAMEGEKSAIQEELRKQSEKVDVETKIREEYERKLKKCEEEIEQIRSDLKVAKMCTFSNFDAFVSDEKKVKFYTGLPSSSMFVVVLDGVNAYMKEQSMDQNRSALEHWQSLLLTLMRLRLSLTLQDLAYRFGVSEATACRVFDRWIDAMYLSLYPTLVNWPDRETLWKTMPREFRESYGNSVAVIIDCFEIFTDKPSSLDTRAMMWSNYKHHHTVKILLGICPTGAITFVSSAWGARASDQQVVSESGLYELLLPHDVVMADRGFNVAEHIAMYGAKLLIPAFTRGQDQLSSHDVSLTRKIAHLRIHVERVIGLVRRKYRILKSILPIELLTKKSDGDVAPIDKIVSVCCALTNLSPSVVVHPETPESESCENI